MYRLRTFTHAWYHRASFRSSVLSLSFDGSLKLHLFRTPWWCSCAPYPAIYSSLLNTNIPTIVAKAFLFVLMRYAEMHSDFAFNEIEVAIFKLTYVFRQIWLTLSEKYSIQLDVFSWSCWSNNIPNDDLLWQVSQSRVSLVTGPVLVAVKIDRFHWLGGDPSLAS